LGEGLFVVEGKEEEEASLCAKQNAVFPQCVGTPPAQEDWQGQGGPGPGKDHGKAAANGRHGRLARLASSPSTIIQPTTNPSFAFAASLPLPEFLAVLLLSDADATEEAVAKRALDEAIAKKAGADMERIRLHPLW
jgi:hypothetical protein